MKLVIWLFITLAASGVAIVIYSQANRFDLSPNGGSVSFPRFERGVRLRPVEKEDPKARELLFASFDKYTEFSAFSFNGIFTREHFKQQPQGVEVTDHVKMSFNFLTEDTVVYKWAEKGKTEKNVVSVDLNGNTVSVNGKVVRELSSLRGALLSADGNNLPSSFFAMFLLFQGPTFPKVKDSIPATIRLDDDILDGRIHYRILSHTPLVVPPMLDEDMFTTYWIAKDSQLISKIQVVYQGDDYQIIETEEYSDIESTLKDLN